MNGRNLWAVGAASLVVALVCASCSGGASSVRPNDAGATTGKVEVVTPSGTLSSNVAYRVKP